MSFKYLVCIDFEATCWPGKYTRTNDAEIIGKYVRFFLLIQRVIHLNYVLKDALFSHDCHPFTIFFQKSVPFFWMLRPELSKINFIAMFDRLNFLSSVAFASIWLAFRSLWSIVRTHFWAPVTSFDIGLIKSNMEKTYTLQIQRKEWWQLRTV